MMSFWQPFTNQIFDLVKSFDEAIRQYVIVEPIIVMSLSKQISGSPGFVLLVDVDGFAVFHVFFRFVSITTRQSVPVAMFSDITLQRTRLLIYLITIMTYVVCLAYDVFYIPTLTDGGWFSKLRFLTYCNLVKRLLDALNEIFALFKKCGFSSAIFFSCFDFGP
ncbi:unnamed protein product [Soboliphyme baturini]|uniref:Ion transport domain-containing protein n=1 Tax=Soboliphyme baturini TaxID=241478 RepID=A0A183J911_9BILA|nr:unnamed protein product [Soboliphyme baturini]